VRQQEHKEQKDVEKATRKRHEERRKTHSLVWVQWEKEGLSLPTTPENTDNNIDGGVVWSGLEEESEDEVPLAVGTKGKDVVLARAAAASVAGAASAGEGTAMVGVPSTGGRAVGAGLEKTQASGVDPTVSSIVVVCILPNFFPSSS
jgi:hypothetical protein